MIEKCKRVLLDLVDAAPSALSRALDVHPVQRYDKIVAEFIKVVREKAILRDLD